MSTSPLSQPGQAASQQPNLRPVPAAAAPRGPRALPPLPGMDTAVSEPVASSRVEPAPSPPQPTAAPGAAHSVTPVIATRPPVGRTKFELRHAVLIVSFLLCVLVPTAITGWYLWFRAADQYASTVGFSVRREEGGSALDLLGGLGQISGASSSDTDILYEFLQSQRLVADLETELNLSQIWSKPGNDPWFAYSGNSIEDLLAYWRRMVRISYEGGSGLIEVRVLAFDPDDATLIAQALMNDSAQMINELSAIAREDSIRFARDDLDEAIERLRDARLQITDFRNRTQIVDPRIDLENQGGLLGNLQAQLAEALIEVDLLRDTARDGDPRMVQAERRVEVIEARIAAERDTLGLGTPGGLMNGFPELVSEYEGLAIELEFAEQAYVASLTAYDAALAESRRTSRYLAAYAQPTRAETSRFPQRDTLLGLGALFLFLAWTIGALIVYALRDRR